VLSANVLEPFTDTVPAVPILIYPALIVGVILELPATVAVINPVALIEIVGVALIVFAGVEAAPAATFF